MKEGETAPCGCVVRPRNVPMTHDVVNTVQLVCSHGISEPDTPEALDMCVKGAEFHNAQMIAGAVASWLGEDSQGDHLKGWLINWDTDTEWCIRMTENGPLISWNRCNDAEYLVDESTASWAFHSEMYLSEWVLYMITLEGGSGITVIDLN